MNFPGGDDPIQFRVKPSTAFGKLYSSIAKSKGIDQKSFRLVHDGVTINPESTPQEVGVENEDSIDFFTQVRSLLPCWYSCRI